MIFFKMANYFRTYGCGKSLEEAYQHAIREERYNHIDLAESLCKITPIEIKKPKGMDPGEFEVKIFMANHAVNCESLRELTTCENNAKNWFLKCYGQNSKQYLEYYENKIKVKTKKITVRPKTCLAVILDPEESLRWKIKNNYIKKFGRVYCFLGCAKYNFNENDN